MAEIVFAFAEYEAVVPVHVLETGGHLEVAQRPIAVGVV